MAKVDFSFRSIKTIAPAILNNTIAAYKDQELTDFEGWIENKEGDRIHLPAMYGTKKYRISRGSRNYAVSLFYHFPETVRNPYVIYTTKSGDKRDGTYGSPNMTFRRLYEILCKKHNQGMSFIDTYFEESDWFLDGNGFISEPVSDILDEAQDKIEEYTKGVEGTLHRRNDGGLDMRYGSSGNYFAATAGIESSVIGSGLRELSKRIKEDIVQKLMLGQIPLLNPWLSDKTVEQKEAAGFDYPKSKFYATGQLINSISVDMYVWSE